MLFVSHSLGLGEKRKGYQKNNKTERKLLIDHILAIKLINLGVDRFYSMKKDLFRCFSSFILSEKSKSRLGDSFEFGLLFHFLND
jgi:hypothetical protein